MNSVLEADHGDNVCIYNVFFKQEFAKKVNMKAHI